MLRCKEEMHQLSNFYIRQYRTLLELTEAQSDVPGLYAKGLMALYQRVLLDIRQVYNKLRTHFGVFGVTIPLLRVDNDDSGLSSRPELRVTEIEEDIGEDELDHVIELAEFSDSDSECEEIQL